MKIEESSCNIFLNCWLRNSTSYAKNHQSRQELPKMRSESCCSLLGSSWILNSNIFDFSKFTSRIDQIFVTFTTRISCLPFGKFKFELKIQWNKRNSWISNWFLLFFVYFQVIIIKHSVRTSSPKFFLYKEIEEILTEFNFSILSFQYNILLPPTHNNKVQTNPSKW